MTYLSLHESKLCYKASIGLFSKIFKPTNSLLKTINFQLKVNFFIAAQSSIYTSLNFRKNPHKNLFPTFINLTLSPVYFNTPYLFEGFPLRLFPNPKRSDTSIMILCNFISRTCRGDLPTHEVINGNKFCNACSLLFIRKTFARLSLLLWLRSSPLLLCISIYRMSKNPLRKQFSARNHIKHRKRRRRKSFFESFLWAWTTLRVGGKIFPQEHRKGLN